MIRECACSIPEGDWKMATVTRKQRGVRKPKQRPDRSAARVDKVMKGFLVRAKLAKDGNETDTQTKGGDKQSDD